MLSIEHVRARRDRERLVLVPLSEAKRLRALEIGAWLLDAVGPHLGATRDEISDAFARVQVAPNERRLALGLTKLVEDDCEFQQLDQADPLAIRSQVFLRAASERRAATPVAPFSRSETLQRSALELQISEARLEEALYADLRGAHRLIQVPKLNAPELIALYEQAQVQAVLLRAVQVVARVQCKSTDTYRSLFHKLKFRRLLFRLERLPAGDYSIVIDGPYSLFEGVTKYGLELAQVLPALQGCDVLELSARVLWGKTRTPLHFEYRHVSPISDGEPLATLRDEVRSLFQEFQALETPWQVSLAEQILELPGVGTCVPDLVFSHRDSSPAVHLEMLGYWSRDAVFRRLELVERGLGRPVLFVAGSRLRVSEALFDGDEPAALYVYRGKPSARAVERKLDAIRQQLVR